MEELDVPEALRFKINEKFCKPQYTCDESNTFKYTLFFCMQLLLTLPVMTN